MRIVLALDLATTLGWAHGSTSGGRVTHGSFKLPSTDDDIGRFLCAYRKWIGEAIEQCNPNEIVFEQPILTKIKNLKTLRKLYGLAGQTELTARDYKVQCLEANLSAIRRHFIGVQNAPRHIKVREVRRIWLKERTVAQARARGFKITDDNEADAIALLSLRLSQLVRGFRLVQAPLERAAA